MLLAIATCRLLFITLIGTKTDMSVISLYDLWRFKVKAGIVEDR